MILINSVIALFRGNIKCMFYKLFHIKSFKFSPRLRMYIGASVSLKNSGRIMLEKNIKIDSQALLAANGGEIRIGNGVGIGRGNIIVSQKKISIGEGTIIAPNVLIYDHDHKFDAQSGVLKNEYNCDEISIGTNCWICANTIILKGTNIGDNCVIGAGCVIKGNIPNGSKVVQKRKTEIKSEVNYENNGCN